MVFGPHHQCVHPNYGFNLRSLQAWAAYPIYSSSSSLSEPLPLSLGLSTRVPYIRFRRRRELLASPPACDLSAILDSDRDICDQSNAFRAILKGLQVRIDRYSILPKLGSALFTAFRTTGTVSRTSRNSCTISSPHTWSWSFTWSSQREQHPQRL